MRVGRTQCGQCGLRSLPDTALSLSLLLEARYVVGRKGGAHPLISLPDAWSSGDAPDSAALVIHDQH